MYLFDSEGSKEYFFDVFMVLCIFHFAEYIFLSRKNDENISYVRFFFKDAFRFYVGIRFFFESFLTLDFCFDVFFLFIDRIFIVF